MDEKITMFRSRESGFSQIPWFRLHHSNPPGKFPLGTHNYLKLRVFTANLTHSNFTTDDALPWRVSVMYSASYERQSEAVNLWAKVIVPGRHREQSAVTHRPHPVYGQA
jgi:hypothetical protein